MLQEDGRKYGDTRHLMRLGALAVAATAATDSIGSSDSFSSFGPSAAN